MNTNLKHPVYDTDTHFTIDPISREMSNTACLKSCLIQHDHNSERFTFEVPKTIEGHDMSMCDSIQVHYINIDSQTKEQSAGVYEVDDMMLTEDPSGDRIYFSWLISHNATEHVGSLSFLLRFSCYGDDGFLSYVWNTSIYSGISISNGIDNGEVIIDDYADILNEWRKETEAFRLLSLEQTQTSTESEGVNIWTATFADGTTRALEVRNGAQGEKGDGIENPDDYVKKTDKATLGGDYGLVKLNAQSDYGLKIRNTGDLITSGATVKVINKLTNENMPITPSVLTYAVKVGLLDNADGFSSSTTTTDKTLSEAEKKAICNWLGTNKIMAGSYVGTGTSPKVLVFDEKPLIVFIGAHSIRNFGFMLNGQYCTGAFLTNGEYMEANLLWSEDGKTLTISKPSGTDIMAQCFNHSGTTYTWVAILDKE